MADALSGRPDFKKRHVEDVSRAKARIESSTLAALRVDHVTNNLASDIKKSYKQDEHCRLHIDHFGGRKVTLLSHLKVKLNRFSILIVRDGINRHLVIQFESISPMKQISNRRLCTSSIMHHQGVIWAVRRHSDE